VRAVLPIGSGNGLTPIVHEIGEIGGEGGEDAGGAVGSGGFHTVRTGIKRT